MNLVITALFPLHFLNDGVRTTFLSLLPFIAKDLHLSFMQIGVLTASQCLLATICALPAGFFASRFGGFKILLFCLIIYSLAGIGSSISSTFITLAIFFYISSIGFGMFHILAYAIVVRNSEKKKVGRNMGNFTAIGDLGRTLIPTIILSLAAFIGWRITFGALALFGLIAYILLKQLFFSKRKELLQPDPYIQQEHHRAWLKQTAILLRDKKLLLVSLAGVLDGLAGNSIFVFVPFLLLQKGIGQILLGIFMGGYFIGSLSGKALLGRGTDRFGNKTIFILAEFFMAALLILFTFLHQSVIIFIIVFFSWTFY